TGVGTGVTGLTGATALTGSGSLGLIAGRKITVSDGTNSTTYTVVNGHTVQDLITAINGGTADVTASIGTGGNLQIQSNNFTRTVTLTDDASPAGTELQKLGYTPGSTTFAPVNLLTQSAVGSNETLTVKVGSNPVQTITFGTGASQISTLAGLQAALSNLTNLTTKTVNTSNGNINLTASNLSDQIVVGGTARASNFGIQKTTALPANGTVVASDVTSFLNESLAGGSITAYDVSGAAANIQLR